MTEICELKRGFLERYQEATEEHVARLRELRERMATLSRNDYNQLRGAVDELRLRSDRARLDLESHVRDHGC